MKRDLPQSMLNLLKKARKERLWLYLDYDCAYHLVKDGLWFTAKELEYYLKMRVFPVGSLCYDLRTTANYIFENNRCTARLKKDMIEVAKKRMQDLVELKNHVLKINKLIDELKVKSAVDIKARMKN